MPTIRPTGNGKCWKLCARANAALINRNNPAASNWKWMPAISCNDGTVENNCVVLNFAGSARQSLPLVLGHGRPILVAVRASRSNFLKPQGETEVAHWCIECK